MTAPRTPTAYARALRERERLAACDRAAPLPALAPLGPGVRTIDALVRRVRERYARELAARGVREPELAVTLEQTTGELVIVLHDGDDRYAQAHPIDARDPSALEKFARTWRPEPRLWSAVAQESAAS
jgi:hypothetical protein